MNDKKAVLLIGAGLTALLVLSSFIAISDDIGSKNETVIIFDDSTAAGTEKTDESRETLTFSSAESKISDTMPPDEEENSINETETEATEPTSESLWININTAGIDELTKLSGIGEVTAMKIIEYRSLNGNFRNIEEIMNVDGIGEKKFEEIRNKIYVDYPVYDVTDSDAEQDYPEEPETAAATEYETLATEESDEPETSALSGLTLEEAAPININTADVSELMLLPYVTEEIAERIIELREGIGGYSHPYELLYIEELEQKQVAEIIEFVTVGQ